MLFLDTEFADITNRHLISIALVSDDGREFYCEQSDFPANACSSFVQRTVLPLLGRRKDDIASRMELQSRLLKWLGQFRGTNPVVIGSDYRGDWDLMAAAIGGSVPSWVQGRDISAQIDEVLVAQFFSDTGLARHHALHDAIANRFSYRIPAS
jgi:3' exoribonuclease, RNase T-like